VLLKKFIKCQRYKKPANFRAAAELVMTTVLTSVVMTTDEEVAQK